MAKQDIATWPLVATPESKVQYPCSKCGTPARRKPDDFEEWGCATCGQSWSGMSLMQTFERIEVGWFIKQNAEVARLRSLNIELLGAIAQINAAVPRRFDSAALRDAWMALDAIVAKCIEGEAVLGGEPPPSSEEITPLVPIKLAQDADATMDELCRNAHLKPTGYEGMTGFQIEDACDEDD